MFLQPRTKFHVLFNKSTKVVLFLSEKKNPKSRQAVRKKLIEISFIINVTARLAIASVFFNSIKEERRL